MYIIFYKLVIYFLDKDEDVESGNGPSLPHSPSSLEIPQPGIQGSDYYYNDKSDLFTMKFVFISPNLYNSSAKISLVAVATLLCHFVVQIHWWKPKYLQTCFHKAW